MHLIDWRSTYLSLDPESDSTLTHVYQLINSLKETRAIFGIIAGVLRLIEEGISHDLNISYSFIFELDCFDKEYQPDNHMHDAIFEEFVALMRAMSHNAQWRALIARSHTTTASGRSMILPSSRPRVKVSIFSSFSR
jgi:hypothetical protein